MQFRLFLLHAGEVDEVVGQGGQTLGLAADIGKPLVFSALHLGQISVCADDGHGGFQLVACVGNELALLLIALCHGAHNAPGQNQQQEQHRCQPQHSQRYAGQQGGVEVGETAAAVQKNDPYASGLILDQKAVVIQKSGGLSGRGCFLSVVGGLLCVHGGNLACVRLYRLTVLPQQNGEETGLVGGFGRHDPLVEQVRLASRRAKGGKVALVLFLLGSAKLGKCAVIGHQQRQQGVGVGDHFLIAHQIDAAQNDQQHHRQREHTGQNELGPQLFDHTGPSKE